MGRAARIRNKRNPRKRGPKRKKAKKPRRIGQKKRRAFRVNAKKLPSALTRYKGGYTLIFKKAGRYCRTLKRLPKPGTCDPDNHFQGYMPALPGDFHLSGPQAATILEKVADAPNTSYAQVRQVSATLSYLHSLMTGKQGTNWKLVKEELESREEKDFVRYDQD